MTRSLHRPVATGLVLLLAAAPLLAQSVYTWKDAKGVTHYSDAPPAKGEYTNRKVSAAPATAATPPAASTSTAATAAAAAAMAKGPPAQDANCAQARLNLTRLQGDAPVGPDADGDGQPDATLDAEGRAKQVAIAEKAIKANCPAG